MSRSTDSLRLFGPFQLTVNGSAVVLGQPRLEELVALLAIHPGEHMPRVQIAHRIWPDSSESQARVNLRNLLHKLRQAWPDMDKVIDVTRTHVVWRDEAGVVVDVQQFESYRTEADRDDQSEEDRVSALTHAAELYRDDFLPTCFSDWALAERERLRSEVEAALEQLTDLLFRHRRYEEALLQAKILQRSDPLRESTYRQLMQIYLALGDRAAALRVYHTCATTLAQELGVEPAPATENLRARLLQLAEQTAQPDAPQAVTRPRLVGRHTEWQQLQRTWTLTHRGVARCVLLWGEAGIGKTRLAEEMIDWMHHQGLAWASSRSYALEGALAYAPIAEWLRSPWLRPLLDEIDDLWRVELSRLLPELLSDRPDLPSPGPMIENWQQQRFLHAIVQAVQAVPGPLLLHLDDMQWSDTETLTLLHFLLHGARARPLLLIGAIRTEDAAGNERLAAFVEAMRHAGQLVELRLGPLSSGEAAELAAQTAGEAIAPAVAETLYATSEGHPLYLVEAIRSGLVKPGAVGTADDRNDGMIPAGIGMPPRIYSLLTTRLGQLSPIARDVADIAAVIGRSFSYEILQAVAHREETELVGALDELWRRQLIREQPGDRYDFCHDRIREVAYQEVSRARRLLYHRQIAEALERVYHNDLDSVAGGLAAHYARAGESTAAYGYYRQAAHVALSQHALPHAEAMFDAALRHVPDDPMARIKLLHEQNRVFHQAMQTGRWRDNLDMIQTLLAEKEPTPLDAQLVYRLDLSSFFNALGYGEQGINSSKAALDLAEQLADQQAITHARNLLASNYWKAGMMRKAGQVLETTIQQARDCGDRELEVRNIIDSARIGIFTDMPSSQIYHLLVRGLKLAEEIGNKELVIDLQGKLGYWHIAVGMGEFDRGEQALRRTIALAEEIGDGFHPVVRLGNLAWLYTNKGDYRQAASALDASRTDAAESETVWVHWVNTARRAVVWREMGDLEAAASAYHKALDRLQLHGVRHFEAQVQLDLGWLHLLAERHGEAESVLASVLDLAEQTGDLRLKALACTRHGYLLEAMEHLEEALEKYQSGCDLHHRMEQHYYAMNARAGMARIAVAQGDHDTARAHVATIWETIGGKEMDATIETARTLRTCYTVFAAHDDPRTDEVLAMAWQQLQRRVASIDDPAVVEKFWQLEDHDFFKQRVVA